MDQDQVNIVTESPKKTNPDVSNISNYMININWTCVILHPDPTSGSYEVTPNSNDVKWLGSVPVLMSAYYTWVSKNEDEDCRGCHINFLIWFHVDHDTTVVWVVLPWETMAWLVNKSVLSLIKLTEGVPPCLWIHATSVAFVATRMADRIKDASMSRECGRLTSDLSSEIATSPELSNHVCSPIWACGVCKQEMFGGREN